MKSVSKINFNGGDCWYYSQPSRRYRGLLADWPLYLEHYIKQHDVGAIMLFGDCRPLHRLAIDVAKKLGVQVWVFEEGYARPDYITLESGGVNGFSSLYAKKADFLMITRSCPCLKASLWGKHLVWQQGKP
ncbi:MAG: hypothetical protein HC765_10695 [Brachymonas sp.]|nr:hypothetical protein [Brachymonas sp.]